MKYQTFTRTCTIIGIVAAVLISCSTGDKPTGANTPNFEGEGSAVVYLPDEIPSDFLAKSNDSSTMRIPPTLSLVITGRGMDSIVRNWYLDSLPDEPVVISGIPAGYNRFFEGRLIKSDGEVSYSGRDTVTIEAGKTVDVHLVLKPVRQEGSASVCIEIEGLPSRCGIDTVTQCFEFNVTNPMFSYYEPFLAGYLSLSRFADTIIGEMTPYYYEGDSALLPVQMVSGYAINDTTYQLYTSACDCCAVLDMEIYVNESGIRGWVIKPDYYPGPERLDLFGGQMDCQSIPQPHNPDDTSLQCFTFSGIQEQVADTFEAELKLTRVDTMAFGKVFVYGWNGSDVFESAVEGRYVSATNSYDIRTYAQTYDGFHLTFTQHLDTITGEITPQNVVDTLVTGIPIYGHENICGKWTEGLR